MEKQTGNMQRERGHNWQQGSPAGPEPGTPPFVFVQARSLENPFANLLTQFLPIKRLVSQTSFT